MILGVLIVPAVIVVLDQIVKALALRRLGHGITVHVIDGLLALRLGFNPGLAFGLLADLDESWRWVIALVSIAALVVLARIAYRIVRAGSWQPGSGLDSCLAAP